MKNLITELKEEHKEILDITLQIEKKLSKNKDIELDAYNQISILIEKMREHIFTENFRILSYISKNHKNEDNAKKYVIFIKKFENEFNDYLKNVESKNNLTIRSHKQYAIHHLIILIQERINIEENDIFPLIFN
ncbi:MAG: hypothetical protein H7832_11425 [Magnetococcus sp. DMHC-6]